MKNIIDESLTAVHTHTHTHNYSSKIKNINNKIEVDNKNYTSNNFKIDGITLN